MFYSQQTTTSISKWSNKNFNRAVSDFKHSMQLHHMQVTCKAEQCRSSVDLEFKVHQNWI